MQMFQKKRIEIFIEAPLLGKIAECLDAAAVTGYSVLAMASGKGSAGAWSADSQVGQAGQMYAVVCIADAAIAEKVVETVFSVIDLQIGMVTISDVAVVRPARF